MIEELTTAEPVVVSRASRWQIAAAAAVALLAAGIGVVLGSFLVASRDAGLSPAAAYVPAGSVMYMEANLDLAPAQRTNLRALIERFPGADADKILTDALAATLDDALGEAHASVDYSSDVAPWFDGQVALAVLDYPSVSDPVPEMPAMAALFGSRDPEAASALGDTLRDEFTAGGATFTSSDHDGTTIWTLTVDPAMTNTLAGVGFAYAVTDDRFILASGTDDLAGLLDVRAGRGESLEQRSDVGQLVARLPEDRVGTMAVDIEAMLAATRAELTESQAELATLLDELFAGVPSVGVASISLETDALGIDGVSQMPRGDLAVDNNRRELASQVPADALFYVDGSDVGPDFERSLASLKATLGVGPMAQEQLSGLEMVENALGADLEEFVSWMGDAAFVAGWDGSRPYGGIVAEAADPEAAKQRLDQLRTLAQLAAMDASTGLTVESVTVAGAEVTTIRYDLSHMFGFGGGRASAETQQAVLEYAVDGNRVLIGLGDRFVRRVLELDASDALSASSRYADAVERFGGTDNLSVTWVDLAGIVEAVGGSADQLGMATWTDEVEPYLAPLDYVAGVSRVEGGMLVQRFALVVE